jgi:thiol-disulfide isomerase/thioredoxin
VTEHTPTDRPERRWGPGILVALAVGLVVFGVVLLGEGGSAVPEGSAPAEPARSADAAVGFSLTLYDGTHFDLATHLAEDGRPVFLNFWASWCPPCRAEMPDISAAAERHPEVLFLGIAVSDSPDAAAAYADEVDVSYRLGFDATGMIEAHYPAPGLPATFLISSSGEIVRSHVGQMHPDVIEQLVVELTG